MSRTDIGRVLIIFLCINVFYVVHTTLHILKVCNHQNLRKNYLTAHMIMGVITHKCTVVDLSIRPAFLIDFQNIKNFDWKKRLLMDLNQSKTSS